MGSILTSTKIAISISPSPRCNISTTKIGTIKKCGGIYTNSIIWVNSYLRLGYCCYCNRKRSSWPGIGTICICTVYLNVTRGCQRTKININKSIAWIGLNNIIICTGIIPIIHFCIWIGNNRNKDSTFACTICLR